MSLVAWKDWNIEISDLRKTLKSFSLPLSEGDGDAEADALDCWDTAKEKLGDKLDVILPNLFVNKAVGNNLGISYEQFLLSRTYSQLDNVKDIIGNKDKLKFVACYMTIKEMLFTGFFTQRLGYQSNNDLLDVLMGRVKSEIKELWETAQTLLWIDLSGDGQETDDERVRTKQDTLWRS